VFLPFVSLWPWQKHGWMLDAGSWTSHRRRCLDTARRLQPNSPKLSAVGWKAKSLVFPKQPTGLPLQNDAPTLLFWEWVERLLYQENRRWCQEDFRFPKLFRASTLRHVAPDRRCALFLADDSEKRVRSSAVKLLVRRRL